MFALTYSSCQFNCPFPKFFARTPFTFIQQNLVHLLWFYIIRPTAYISITVIFFPFRVIEFE
jgi:hypothetical protein